MSESKFMRSMRPMPFHTQKLQEKLMIYPLQLLCCFAAASMEEKLQRYFINYLEALPCHASSTLQGCRVVYYIFFYTFLKKY